MDNRSKFKGIVLSVMSIGDYDRRVTILTKERGKIAAFARGARRPGSLLLGACQPFVFGDFILTSNGNSYAISEVEVEDYFAELREDLEQIYFAMYFCEVADFYTRENNDEREMLKLLYASLRAMVKRQMSNRLIKTVFEIKTVYINGEGPMTAECMDCGSKNDEDRLFSVIKGGRLCSKCGNKAFHSGAESGVQMNSRQYKLLSDGGYDPAVARLRTLDPSAWYALWFIGNTPVAKLFSFTVSQPVEDELAELAGAYLAFRSGHEFKGDKLLDMFQI